jgi:hypothetical protein
MSKIDRVLPAGGFVGSTSGNPVASGRLMPYALGEGVNEVDCRNGWFWALDDDVPPGLKFQNLPQPPRMSVFPSPVRS